MTELILGPRQGARLRRADDGRLPPRILVGALDSAVSVLLFVLVAWLADSALATGTGFLDERPAGHDNTGLDAIDAPAVVLAALVPLAVGAVGGYGPRPRSLGTRIAHFGRLWSAAALCVWTTWLVSAAAGWSVDLDQLATLWAAMPVGWLLVHVTVGAVLRPEPERVLVMGTGRVGRHVAALARRHPECRMRVVGFLDDEPLPLPAGAPPLLGSIHDLGAVIDKEQIGRVVVCFSRRGDAEVLRVVRECDALGVDVDVVPRLFDLMGPEPRAHALGGLPLIAIRGRRASPEQRAIKRTLDLAGAGILLALLAPVMLALVALVVLDDRGPVLYRQVRVGWLGRPFSMMKLRTMRAGADRIGMERIAALRDGGMSIEEAAAALKQGDDPRITRIGGFLRRTSLDELPQLWNVLKGDMSLVGPRPLRDFEVEQLHEWETDRLRMRPGMTGLWQILGRSEVDWGERMQLDYSYVRHWSVGLDLRILGRTAAIVLSRKGAV